MTISIWYKPEDGKAEVVDKASSRPEAERLANEYNMAFGCAYRQHRYGKDKVWAGRRDEEPK